jgi:hypothetical protein
MFFFLLNIPDFRFTDLEEKVNIIFNETPMNLRLGEGVRDNHFGVLKKAKCVTCTELENED